MNHFEAGELNGSPEPNQGVLVKTSHLALAVGLVLGTVWAFGGFGKFLGVAVCAAIAHAIGLAIEGRLDVSALTDRWRR